MIAEGTDMIAGKKVVLRTVRPEEVDYVHSLISDINRKGPFWHLTIQPLNIFRQEYAKSGFWGMDEGRMLVMSHDGDYLGEILYFKGLDYQSGYEVGYELFDVKFRGHGYMTEALSLFCSYMFAVRPINRIQVNIMSDNIPSIRVVEKCGFTYEGTMRSATFHNGRYHDLRLYSLLKEECAPFDMLMEQSRGE
jgi:ribosomal-protein-alanine N-acetyltransferase